MSIVATETVTYGGSIVIVYGGISLDAKTDLVFVTDETSSGGLTAYRYIEKILQENVVPYSEFVGDSHANVRQYEATCCRIGAAISGGSGNTHIRLACAKSLLQFN